MNDTLISSPQDDTFCYTPKHEVRSVLITENDSYEKTCHPSPVRENGTLSLV